MGCAALAGACASIAGLDPIDTQPGPGAGEAGASSTTSSGAPDARADGRSNADGGTTGALRLGERCEQGFECITGTCNEARTCSTGCQSGDDECTPGGDGCCAGTSCQFRSLTSNRCKDCLGPGKLTFGQEDEVCCSRRAENGTCSDKP